jgi:hypothetical protein
MEELVGIAKNAGHEGIKSLREVLNDNKDDEEEL